MKIPASHPRARSLKARHRISDGIRRGITSVNGLIAHGRGEAFDYMLGEKTHPFATSAMKAAAMALLRAKRPMISVNGNVAALAGKAVARFSNRWKIPLEVNIFHHTKIREKKIIRYLKNCGARQVLGDSSRPYKKIPFLNHPRSKMDLEGIAKADVILVPLEDGDRCEALKRLKKKIITIDLNPLSRTARTADITIVDELTRAIAGLNTIMSQFHKKPLPHKQTPFNNRFHLRRAEKTMRNSGAIGSIVR